MKNLSILLFLALFIGCQNHPKTGDWYEHKGSGKRIKIISVGTGKFLSSIDNKKIDSEMLFVGNSVKYYYSKEDSLNDCVMFSTFDLQLKWFEWNITSIDKFKQDYKLVE